MDAAHLVICNHCSMEIKRGKAGSSRANWTLKNFKYHMEKNHPDAFKKVEEKQTNGCIASWINKKWKRESVVLACSPFNVRHTSANIAEWIQI